LHLKLISRVAILSGCTRIDHARGQLCATLVLERFRIVIEELGDLVILRRLDLSGLSCLELLDREALLDGKAS
jgi:hypothetical protein